MHVGLYTPLCPFIDCSYWTEVYSGVPGYTPIHWSNERQKPYPPSGALGGKVGSGSMAACLYTARVCILISIHRCNNAPSYFKASQYMIKNHIMVISSIAYNLRVATDVLGFWI